MRAGRWTGLILLVALLMATGCTSSEDGDRLRVVFWAGLEEMQVEQANVDAFMAANPGIEVSLESIPDNYLEKLVTAFAAHKPPDVLLLDSVLIPRFLSGDVLLDLAPHLAADPEFDESVFFPEVWQIAARDGHVWALPKDFTPLVVYYNRRAFEAAGEPYPEPGWNWQDFHDTAQRLTYPAPGSSEQVPADQRRYGTQIYTTPIFNIVWFWQAGGDVLSPDGSRAQGFLDGPAGIEAVEFFTGLVADGLAPDPTAREALGGQAFQSGRIAMTISGHWSMPGFRRAAADAAELAERGQLSGHVFTLDDVGVVGLPQGRERASVIYESGWAVAKDAKQPELAVKLAKYLAGEECQRRRAAIGLAISANRHVAAELAEGDAREQAFLSEVEYGRAPWGTRIADWSIVEDLLSEGIERVILGRATAEESMQRTAELIDAELKMF